MREVYARRRGDAVNFALCEQGSVCRFVPIKASCRASGSAVRESGAHPFALLGFDPIALWMAVRDYYPPRGAPPPRPAR